LRLMSLDRIEKNMVLGKAVHDMRGNVLLPAGSSLSGTYIEHLRNFNIHFLYIDDEISKDIEPWSILSLHTRQNIAGLMRQAERVYQPVADDSENWIEHGAFKIIADMIATDITAQPELRIDVSEILTNNVFLYEHELNVAIISGLIGRMLGMSGVEIKHLCLGGLMHDLGRLALAADIREKLDKQSALTPVELQEFKRYPLMGFNLIKNDNSLSLSTKAAVLHHMEHFDGTGFPTRKKEDEIVMSAKIVAIANMFDELFSGRGMEFGNRTMKIHEVIEYIQSHSGSIFDHELTDEFVKHAIAFPSGSIVKLADGRKGIVANQNAESASRPIIRITHDVTNKPTYYTLNLMEDLSVEIADIEI